MDIPLLAIVFFSFFPGGLFWWGFWGKLYIVWSIILFIEKYKKRYLKMRNKKILGIAVFVVAVIFFSSTAVSIGNVDAGIQRSVNDSVGNDESYMLLTDNDLIWLHASINYLDNVDHKNVIRDIIRDININGFVDMSIYSVDNMYSGKIAGSSCCCANMMGFPFLFGLTPFNLIVEWSCGYGDDEYCCCNHIDLRAGVLNTLITRSHKGVALPFAGMFNNPPVFNGGRFPCGTRIVVLGYSPIIFIDYT